MPGKIRLRPPRTRRSPRGACRRPNLKSEQLQHVAESPGGGEAGPNELPQVHRADGKRTVRRH
jgi:hypothetical protein